MVVPKKYDCEYKVQAIKLAKETGFGVAILSIRDEDMCSDTYGHVRMHQVLCLKKPEGVDIPLERTIYRSWKSWASACTEKGAEWYHKSVSAGQEVD